MMVAEVLVAVISSQACFTPDAHAFARSVDVPLSTRVFVFGRQGLVLLDALDGAGHFRDMDGGLGPVVAPQLMLGGRRVDNDVWLHLGKPLGDEEVFEVSTTGAFRRLSGLEYDQCQAFRSLERNEVCVNGVLLSENDGSVLIRRPAAKDIKVKTRAGVRFGPGAVVDTAMVQRDDMGVLEKIAELRNHVIPLPEFPLSSYQCANRYCWAVGAQGEVAILNRKHRRWRRIGSVPSGFSEVVIGGEERAVLYDRRCPGRVTVIVPPVDAHVSDGG